MFRGRAVGTSIVDADDVALPMATLVVMPDGDGIAAYGCVAGSHSSGFVECLTEKHFATIAAYDYKPRQAVLPMKEPCRHTG